MRVVQLLQIIRCFRRQDEILLSYAISQDIAKPLAKREIALPDRVRREFAITIVKAAVSISCAARSSQLSSHYKRSHRLEHTRTTAAALLSADKFLDYLTVVSAERRSTCQRRSTASRQPRWNIADSYFSIQLFHITLFFAKLLSPDASVCAHHDELMFTARAKFSGYVGNSFARSGGIWSKARLLSGPAT